jgi:hypothetical protein
MATAGAATILTALTLHSALTGKRTTAR